MFSFLHNTFPVPIAFSVGVVSVHWYGLLMVFAGVVAFYVALYVSRWYGIAKDDFYDLAFYWIIFAVVGARVYYVLYAWEFYADNWWSALKVWEGGLAIHGALIGGIIAFLWFSIKKRLSFWILADVTVVGVALGQAIGRWGNYFNQEIFGRPTDLPWGIPIAVTKRPFGFLEYNFFHPTFLYESIVMAVVAALLFLLHYLRKKRGVLWLPDGAIFLLYLMLYAVVRFCMEFLRLDFSPLVFGMRWAQLFSVLLFFVAGVLLVGAYKTHKKNKAVLLPIKE